MSVGWWGPPPEVASIFPCDRPLTLAPNLQSQQDSTADFFSYDGFTIRWRSYSISILPSTRYLNDPFHTNEGAILLSSRQAGYAGHYNQGTFALPLQLVIPIRFDQIVFCKEQSFRDFLKYNLNNLRLGRSILIVGIKCFLPGIPILP